MAHYVYYTYSELPSDMVDVLVEDLKKYDESIEESVVRDREGNPSPTATKGIRKSSNGWIDSSNWIGGFVWYYITRANRENFMYDIIDIDGGQIQYTEYKEGEYYDWHVDDDIGRCLFNDKLITSADNHGQNLAVLAGEYIRKLSFTIQLSDPKDYEGGELEFLCGNDEAFFAPNKKGTIIIFDSRTQHRVCKVTKGVRKSLVGWVVGPRWK